jgi:hypothetical protein
LSICDVFFYHSFILFSVIMNLFFIITHTHTHTHSLTLSLSHTHTQTHRRPFRGADNIATFMCRLYRNHGRFNLVDNQVSIQTCIGLALPTITPLPGRQTHINILLLKQSVLMQDYSVESKRYIWMIRMRLLLITETA